MAKWEWEKQGKKMTSPGHSQKKCNEVPDISGHTCPTDLKAWLQKFLGIISICQQPETQGEKMSHEDHRSWARKFWLYIQTIPTRAGGEEVTIRTNQQGCLKSPLTSSGFRGPESNTRESRKAKTSINNSMNVREVKEWKEQRKGEKEHWGKHSVAESTWYMPGSADHEVYVVISSIL